MATPRKRTDRIQFRTSAEKRRLFDRAVESAGGTLTEFAETNLVLAAQRVVADRARFTLPVEAVAEWETLNERPARDLPGLRALLKRESPFAG
ncbi:MAG: DUF1778 domain-containing protein [Acidimicrobiia bacterium]